MNNDKENITEHEAINDGIELYVGLLSMKVDKDDDSDFAQAITALQNAHKKHPKKNKKLKRPFQNE